MRANPDPSRQTDSAFSRPLEQAFQASTYLTNDKVDPMSVRKTVGCQYTNVQRLGRDSAIDVNGFLNRS